MFLNAWTHCLCCIDTGLQTTFGVVLTSNLFFNVWVWNQSHSLSLTTRLKKRLFFYATLTFQAHDPLYLKPSTIYDRPLLFSPWLNCYFFLHSSTLNHICFPKSTYLSFICQMTPFIRSLSRLYHSELISSIAVFCAFLYHL